MTNKKLSYQRVGLFEIVRKIGKLAYKLRLPTVMRIHPVVLIAQLKPAKGKDPYNRKRPDHPGPVEIENSEKRETPGGKSKAQAGKLYKMEQIMDKRVWRYGRRKLKTKYQVKWVGWGPK